MPSMITFRRFLLEKLDSAESVEQFAKLVKRDCQPFLRESGGAFFLRGMNPDKTGGFTKSLFGDGDKNFLVGAVRNDRRPKDSPRWLHDALNEYFIKKTGIPVRSTSLFVSADRGIVEHYGNAYIIFPIGEFHYAWSKQFADPSYEMFIVLAQDKTLPSERLSREFMRFMKSTAPEAYAECEGDLEEWISDEPYSNFERKNGLWATFVKSFLKSTDLWLFDKGLKQAATQSFKEHEVMLVCDKYYAIGTSYFSALANILDD